MFCGINRPVLRRLSHVALPLALCIVTATTPAGHAYRRPGATRLVSVAAGPANVVPTVLDGDVGSADISANGRFVAFDSDAPNLVPNDTNGASDVFVRDLRSGRTERISLSSEGLEGKGGCGTNPANSTGAQSPAISDNGRYVSFLSCFVNLVPGDTNRSQDVFINDLRTRTTKLVSVQIKPDVDEHQAQENAISGNGRFVAWRSPSDSHVKKDTNGITDVFVRDMRRGVTQRVSVTSDGKEAKKQEPEVFVQGANCPSLSSTGRFVAFTSSTPLVEDDLNGARDIFVHDRRTGKTSRVSVGSDGREARGLVTATMDQSGGCWEITGRRTISGNGRFVAYHSSATNLIPNDANGRTNDVYVFDRKTRRTERISVDSAGGGAPLASFLSAISANGRFVTFESYSSFFPGDTNTGEFDLPVGPAGIGRGDSDIFMYDRKFGSLEWLSTAPDGSESRLCVSEIQNTVGDLLEQTVVSSVISRQPSVSGNGRYVAFKSCADNLVEEDKDIAWDAFVRDRGPDLGVGAGASDADDSISIPGLPGFSARGITAAADAGNDAGGASLDEAEILSSRLAFRPTLEDLYAVLELRRGPSLVGSAGILYGFGFQANDTLFEARASTAGHVPFELFRCSAGRDRSCTRVGELEGGYGTTGDRITMSIPLDDLNLSEGGTMSDVRAFTAATEPVPLILDEVRFAPPA